MNAITFKDVRRGVYENNRKKNPVIFDTWKWYSYRRFKAYFYMQGESVLASLFLKLSVPANVVTLLYALMGILGGIFLAIPSRACVIIALFFYFTRGIFDWADGSVARAMKRTSIDGTVFDSYGAHVGWVFLWTGMGFYLANYTAGIFWYFLPAIPALLASDLYANARETLIYHGILRKEKDRLVSASNADKQKKRGVMKFTAFKGIIDKAFEHNARTVDLILLIILIEIITTFRILWVFYSAFLLWQIAIFTIRILMVTRGKLAERELTNLHEKVYE